MTDDQMRILFFATGLPTFARLPEFSSYDRRVAEQLYENLTAPQERDEEDLEYELSVERDIEMENAKYGQNWGE